MSEGDRYLTLYGDMDGRWVLWQAPLGTISPPTVIVAYGDMGQIYTLTRLGEPSSLITVWHRALIEADPKAPAQRMIADALGVGQQYVSKLIAGGHTPYLTTSAWAVLATISARMLQEDAAG